jgi:carbonic anhydrase/acetyltransferase-like protein (isoleucine patch superfamily)
MPKIHPTAFVEASAHVIGDVELGVVHVNSRGSPTILEEFVTVGHGARLRADYKAMEDS